MTQHISSAYDRDLEAIQTLVVKMGGMVEKRHHVGCDILGNPRSGTGRKSPRG